MLRDADPRSFKAIYVVCGRTDMRLGIDSLAAIIESRYHLPLFVPGTLFLFCGRNPCKIKGLVWEGDGFLLFTKRIESGCFSWPRTSDEAQAISPIQFEWLMKGFGIEPRIRDVLPEKSA